MKLSDVTALIEKRMPKSWAEEWDNPGLAFGRLDSEVSRIALALDATPESVSDAAALGCRLLVAHHPIIFRPLRSIVDDTLTGRTLLCAAEKGVAIYAAHTNWDSSPEGVNCVLASLLALEGVEPLVCSQNGAWGMGAVGELPEPLLPASLEQLLHVRWRLYNFTFYGDSSNRVKKIALGGGACQEFWRDALAYGADCFITADVSYHVRQEALAAGLRLVSADHGEMERASLPALKKILEEETTIPVFLLEERKSPFEHWSGNQD